MEIVEKSLERIGKLMGCGHVFVGFFVVWIGFNLENLSFR